MARGKKKETLTPEEGLQAALVPESEQPYKVPRNWCWVSLETVDQYQAFSTAPSKYPDTLFELYSVPSSADNYPEIVLGCEIGSTKQSVQKGDILLCKINPRINRVWKVSQYTDNPLLASSEWIIIRNSKIVSDYLMHCFRAPYFREYMLSNVSGVGGSLMRAQPKYVKTYPVPVPPLPEQQRIVDRIESLFAKLDEAKQKAQDALDSFETRKAAILHKAFTGELTAQWRKEHGVGMESWQTKKYSEICNIVRGGSPRPAGSPEFYGGNIPFMKVADITRNTGPYVNSTEYTIKEAGLKKTRMVDRNTLLLTNSGATLGVPAICTFKTTFNDGIAVFLGLNPDTLLFHYYFWTSKTAALRAINKGAAQPNLNTDIIGNVEISLPRENEQCEIVRILDNLLAKEQQANEAAEGVLEQIDLIKKAILSRAFRGELGTNDPSEESAVELLKQVLQTERWC